MYFDVDEKFSSKASLNVHYNKHGSEIDVNLSKEDYELLAEDLQLKPVDNKTIFGYIGEHKGREAYYKYDKSIGILVAYYYDNNEPLTITCYPQDFRKYQARKAVNYLDEIPKGK